LARPPSSLGASSFLVWATQGYDTAIIAGVARTPGRISRANARVGGKAALRLANALLALLIVGPSSRMEALRLSDCEANAAIVVLKFEIRSLSCSSLRS